MDEVRFNCNSLWEEYENLLNKEKGTESLTEREATLLWELYGLIERGV